MTIDIDKLIFWLLCLYAFLVPFETILDVLFGIDTILKPYRITSLLLLGAFAVRQFRLGGITINDDFLTDGFLYAMLIYGLFITAISSIIAPFSLPKFYNELFQTGLYFGIFVLIKTISLSRQQLFRILSFLVLGIVCNGLYVLYNFYILKNLGRQSGFFDNPNYFSLSLAVAIPFIVMILRAANFYQKVALLGLLPFLFMAFGIAGSRMGFLVLSTLSLLVIWFQPHIYKIGALAAVLLGLFYVQVVGIEQLPANLIGEGTVLQNRLANRDASEDPRIPIWKGVLRASEQTYFRGLGIGQFKARFSEFYQDEHHDLVYRIVNYGYHLSAHNDYLEILITYGIIGLLLFLLFLFYSLKKILLQIRAANTYALQNFHQIKLLLLVGILLFGLSSTNFVSGLYWILLSLSTKNIQNT